MARCSGSSRSINRSACSRRKLGQERRPVVRAPSRSRCTSTRPPTGSFRTLLLGVEIEVRERLGGQLGLDQPQDVDLLAGRQGIDQLGEVGGVASG